MTSQPSFWTSAPTNSRFYSLAISYSLFGLLFFASLAAEAAEDKHIVLIAGPITGHGKQTHEYEKSAVLLKHLLDRSGIKGIRTTVVFDGWPTDPTILDSASTIVMITDGGDHNEKNHPLYNNDRFQQLEKQMKRGCGLVQLHWSTFNPSRFHDRITEWVGGYFDYEKGTAANKWYSAIKHYTEPIRLGEPEHPISAGVKPFRVLEEFYYRIRFREQDPRLKKIVLSKPTGENKEFAVGWAVQRDDGGRGFGFTGGHYYSNWWNPNFRKLVLNAIVWTAQAKVPTNGVESILDEPKRMLIVTGHNHPAHEWRSTTAVLIRVLENDPRVFVDVTEDPEFLANKKLNEYDSIVMNYSSWDRKGLSQQAKQGFVNFLKNGGGLSVIHFANGSWTDTLPNKESDWPEYRNKIVRRVWVHGSGNSGHDAFGNFRVTKTQRSHPITEGLKDFNTQDELYYRQQGPLPIEPLISAKSRDTKKDEPMAWAYRYEKARVFQTVLGHADVSILMASDIIRRGTIWTAGLENLSFDPTIARKAKYIWRSGSQWTPTQSRAAQKPAVKKKPALPASLPQLAEGKFGKALNAKAGGVLAQSSKEIRDPDLTFECWVKLQSKTGFNIIAASETKSSLKHWELYTYAGTGYLSVYMPGIFGEIKSEADVCDGKWHYIAMTFEKQFVRLYVDGKKVKEQPINFRKHPETKEGFAIGCLVEKSIGCDGLIDEVRLSSEVKEINSIPKQPFPVEKSTIGLWRFDQLDSKKKVKDQSPRKNDVATIWSPIAGKGVAKQETGRPKKVTGHWGEDAIGFRWTEKDSEDNRWAFTRHGRFLASTIPLPGGFAEKGLVIKVGEKEEVSVCYDLKRLNMMAAWSGGFLEFHQARFGLIRHLKPVGSMMFHNLTGLGWSDPTTQYIGLYPHNDRVVLDYKIGTTRILESPWLEKNGDTLATTREFRVGLVGKELWVPLSSFSGARETDDAEVSKLEVDGVSFAVLEVENDYMVAAVQSDNPSTKVVVKNNQLWLKLGKSDSITSVKSLIWRGSKKSLAEFKKLVSQSKLKPIAELSRVGKKLWPESVTTTGAIGEQNGLGYTVDTIRLPFKNPYNSLFFVSGHDWFDNGDMVVATVHGEVWLAKNVDEKLDRVVWKRYATGLYQPLGIRVVQNKAYVLCRDQIVRLWDRDQNDEADFYECFHADVTTSTGVHDYVCCLETDVDGNFYYIHANDGVVRVSADGKKKMIVATGFRNPNGMGVRFSDGLVTAAPQEGEWTPASAVCEVIEGRHYGYRGPKQKTVQSPLGYEKPLVFLPRLVDNSSGGQFWSNSENWGLLNNRMFHLSYGKCTMHLVLRDIVRSDDNKRIVETQGAVVPFPFEFESGVCRGRMSPHDGQLYLSGLKGWTTTAVRDGCLQRVRFTGEAKAESTFCPNSYKVFTNGIELGFTHPVDPQSIQSTSFTVQAWNYRYSKNYGSPEFKISNPNQQGRDQWLVQSVRMLDGNRKLFLEIPELKVADQVAIGIKVGAEKSKYDGTLYATIKKKRSATQIPGKPFNSSLVKFEKSLRPGVFVKSHGWSKPTLDYFSTGNRDLEAKRIRKGLDPTRGVSLVTYLKIESAGTKLHLQTNQNTFGSYRISNLTEQVSLTKARNGEIDRNSQVTLPVSIGQGYCRIEVELKATSGPIQCKWNWESNDFSIEPLPSRSLFLEKNWLPKPEKGSYPNRFLEASEILLDHRCTHCHDLGQSPQLKSEDLQIDFRLQRRAPDLINLANRRTEDFILRKILNPEFESHGGEMPRMFDAENQDHLQEVRDIASFLGRGKSVVEKAHQADKAKLESGERLFEQLGCIGCHHLPVESGDDKYERLSLKFTSGKFTRDGLRSFLLDPHRHAPYRKMGNFGLSKEEADSLAVLIEKYSVDNIEVDELKALVGNAQRGKTLFVERGCVQCHQVTDLEFKPQLRAIQNTDSGCLSLEEKEDRNVFPRLGLTDDQKQLLAYHIHEFKGGAAFTKSTIDEALHSFPVWKQSQKLMKELRCGTCHTTEAGSALLPEIVLEEGILGLNPERLPNLGQVGSKLQGDYMLCLLTGKEKVKARPWLKTRMPAFGKHGITLAHGMTHQSGYDHRKAASDFQADRKLSEVGFQLTGQSLGLDCRQCHGVADQPPRGDEKTQIVLGVNFSLTHDRLRKEYYDRWMRDPLRIDPQTKMPKYSADGRTTKITEILEGDASRQFEALWHYLKSVAR